MRFFSDDKEYNFGKFATSVVALNTTIKNIFPQWAFFCPSQMPWEKPVKWAVTGTAYIPMYSPVLKYV